MINKLLFLQGPRYISLADYSKSESTDHLEKNTET